MHVLEPGKAIKLDKKDRRILTLLAENVRTPARTIAKAVQLSPEAVSYRINRLKERKILTGARTLIDLRPLGYASHHVFLSLHPPSTKAEQVTRAYLNGHPQVNAVLQFLGKWDYEVSVRAKTPHELDAFLGKLGTDGAIKDARIVTILSTIAGRVIPGALEEGHKRTQARNAPLPDPIIDAGDLAILRAIADNATMTKEAIAIATKLTRDQVHYRMRRLEEHGIILGYRPVINFAALGYSVHALLLTLSRDPAEETRLATALAENPNVLWAVRTLGAWHAIIYLVTKDTEELATVMTGIRERFASIITSYELLIGYAEHKYTYLPGPIDHSATSK
jgi:Lrp/AsnC family leucine-responsive transcriptional regulator